MPTPTTTSPPPSSSSSSKTTSPATPSLQVTPATPTDIPHFSTLFLKAFATDPLFRILLPPTPSVRAWWDEANTHDFHHQPGAQFLKVSLPHNSSSQAEDTGTTNTGGEQILAYAKYIHHPAGPIVGDFMPTSPPITWPEPSSAPLCHAFFSTLESRRIALMGEREHWYLEMVVVDPEWQGRGIGRRLVQWGCERADGEEVEVYLDASPGGRGVYEREGFRERGEAFEMVFVGERGEEVVYREGFMVRAPRGKERRA